MPIKEEPSDFEVPINLRNAHDIGCLQLELTYDPELLKVLEVIEGDLSSTMMVEFNTDSPGRVVIGIVDEEGINGDVLAATVKFEVLQRGTPCTLSIANAVAYDVATLNTVPSSSTPGAFEGDADSVTFPVLMFSS